MQMVDNFKKSLKFTLKWEGGYINDPSDPGGETKWGISKKAYPDLDIASLSADQAAAIYAKDYWDKCGCDNLAYPLCTVVFDAAVNTGVSRAMGWLRKADGLSTGNASYAILEQRREYYIDLCNKNTNLIRFAKGWWARNGDLRKLVDIALTT